MANIKISELNELGRANRSNDDYVPIVDSSADETKKISIQSLIQNNEQLIAVTNTAPVSYNTGDKYYDTTDNRIYTATSGGWANPEEPIVGITYVIISDQLAYVYDSANTTLVSVGGGVTVHDSYNASTTEPYSANYSNNNFQLKGTILYNNASGSASSITLNESANNYDYIEIYYKTNDNGSISSRKIYRLWGNANKVDLDYGWYVGNTIYYKTANVNINGTSVTFSNNMQYTDFASKESGSFILITRVVGYN